MKIKLLILFCYISSFIYSQTDFIYKQIGNIPVLLIASHGGDYKPYFINDRDCINCKYTKDNNTKELMLLVSVELEKTWGIPNYIYTNVHRSKIDFNRPILEATDSNQVSRIYYNSFHDFIKFSTKYYNNTLVVDFHGHNNSNKLMIGYGIELTNNSLYWGKQSFGYLFNKYSKTKLAYPPTLPKPSGYLKGGYITQLGYSNSEFIQLEFPVNMRTGDLNKVAKAVAKTITKYYEIHYGK